MVIIDKSILESVEFIASCASILTAIIAVLFYSLTVRKNYYLNDIKGNYKIFSGLKGKQTATVLYNIKITHVTSSGWFFGSMKYSEIFDPMHSGSGGILSVYGKLNYNPFRVIIGFLYRILRWKRFNPLETTDFGSFHGILYVLSRNDLNTTERNWKDMLVKEYHMIHYRYANRFRLYDKTKKENSYQLIDELTLINVVRVSDPMYDDAEIRFLIINCSLLAPCWRACCSCSPKASLLSVHPCAGASVPLVFPQKFNLYAISGLIGLGGYRAIIKVIPIVLDLAHFV